jgi:hypothetical protein
MRFIYIAMMIAGATLACFANLQLSIGALLFILGYTEFRKNGLSLDQIDEIIGLDDFITMVQALRAKQKQSSNAKQ